MKIFKTPTYQRKVLLLIIILSVMRWLVATALELGNDEAYYWLYSQHLQWNYFDHPPIVAIWIRLFSFNLSFISEGFLRLGSITGCALSSWFLYKTVATMHSEKAGWFAACLYNASFYAGITAGVYIMPDTPQMVFWTLSMWMIARLVEDDSKWINWILFGIASGLCIMSKVHGIFIWFGFGLFILFQKREWFAKPQLYISLLLAIAIASPILFWNIQNNFVTYRFHSKRVLIHGLSFHTFSKEVLSQFFFNNPFNVVLIISGMMAWRKGKVVRLGALSVFYFIGLPLALILLFISISRNTLPHWSGPAYISLLPLAAVALAEKTKNSFPVLMRWSVGSFIFILVCWTLTVKFYPGTFGNKTSEHLGNGDLTVDMYGWREAGQEFAAFYRNEIKSGSIPAGSPVVCSYWWGAHVEYYFCRPAGCEMIGLGAVQKIHQYSWINPLRKKSVNMSQAWWIMPSDEMHTVDSRFINYYGRIELVKTIKTFRNNKPAHNFYVYKLSGWKGW